MGEVETPELPGVGAEGVHEPVVKGDDDLRPGDSTSACAGNANRVALPTGGAAVDSRCVAPGCTLTLASAAAVAATEGYPNGPENEYAGNLSW